MLDFTLVFSDHSCKGIKNEDLFVCFCLVSDNINQHLEKTPKREINKDKI